MKPPIAITNPKFVYVNAAQTDIRATFARIRREQNQQRDLPNVVLVPVLRRRKDQPR